MIQPDRMVAEIGDLTKAMRDNNHRSACSTQVVQVLVALSLELLVPNRDHLIDDEDLRANHDSDRETQSDVHPAGEVLKGGINVLPDVSELDDLVNEEVDLTLGESKDGCVEPDVLPPGQLRVESGADLQKSGDTPIHPHKSRGRPVMPQQDLECRGLTGPVVPDNPQ